MYPYLVWYGPQLDANLHAQELVGELSVPPPYSGRRITIRVREPYDTDSPDYPTHCSEGTWTYFTLTNSYGRFFLGPAETGNFLFGTICRGTWEAVAQYNDPYWGLIQSNVVTWTVRWFPVHLEE